MRQKGWGGQHYIINAFNCFAFYCHYMAIVVVPKGTTTVSSIKFQNPLAMSISNHLSFNQPRLGETSPKFN